MKLNFRQFTEAAMFVPSPNDPTGQDARKFYINRIPPPEMEELQAAKQALLDGDNASVLTALSHVQKAMGIVGSNSPHFKTLELAANFLSPQASGKTKVDIQRSLQAINIAIQQVNSGV